ncbi:MAG: TRAP transporter small permease subunit [Rhodospirillaceae bacterium]|nr:TRAP transporter small permease subunit [Rhodospirillaceae bacterium]
MLKLLDRTIEILIGLLAVALLVTAFGQVVARYAFGQPFTWVLELDVLLLVWLAMLSGYIGIRRNIHMAVEFVVAKFPRRLRRFTSLASVAASAAFTATLAWTSLPVIDSMEGMDFTALGIGQPWMYWAVPTGGVLMLIAFAVEFRRRLADRPAA